MATDLTVECVAGQDAPSGAKSPHIYSSAAWMGFMAGQQIRGMSSVRKARMGRGYTVQVETMGGNTVVVTFDKRDLSRMTVVRS